MCSPIFVVNLKQTGLNKLFFLFVRKLSRRIFWERHYSFDRVVEGGGGGGRGAGGVTMGNY